MNKQELQEAFVKEKNAHPELDNDTVWQLVKDHQKLGECKLYLCNECCDTFRSLIQECSHCCSDNVECLSEFNMMPAKKEDTYKVIASGFEDKNDAEELARKKKGKVVQGDDKKYSVTIQEGMGDDYFTTPVKYNYSTKDDDYVKSEVNVIWAEDIRYSRWGINDISVQILKPLVISDGEKDITIPVENIEIEWEEGYYYQPVELEVNGDKATVIFSFISKTYNP